MIYCQYRYIVSMFFSAVILAFAVTDCVGDMSIIFHGLCVSTVHAVTTVLFAYFCWQAIHVASVAFVCPVYYAHVVLRTTADVFRDTPFFCRIFCRYLIDI